MEQAREDLDAGAIVDLLDGLAFIGGSTKEYIVAAVVAYLSQRADFDQTMLEKVMATLTEEDAAKFVESSSRTNAAIALDVMSGVEKAILTKAALKLRKDDLKNHNQFRFITYRILANGYGYVRRTPLPVLAELLIKAIFPGAGPSDWTLFMSGRIDAVKPAEEPSVKPEEEPSSRRLAGSKRQPE
jgi:hypothetical protein